VHEGCRRSTPNNWDKGKGEEKEKKRLEQHCFCFYTFDRIVFYSLIATINIVYLISFSN